MAGKRSSIYAALLELTLCNVFLLEEIRCVGIRLVRIYAMILFIEGLKERCVVESSFKTPSRSERAHADMSSGSNTNCID